MSELAAPLHDVLEATGFLSEGAPAAPTVTLAHTGTHTRLPSFKPDAWWRSSAEPSPWRGNADLKVYFKFVEEPAAAPVAEWQKEIWNQGFCPLLWLVSPEQIELYNGFGRPQLPDDAHRNQLDTFLLVDEELARLDAFAGRLAMETGQFWRHAPGVNRKTSVDGQLLHDLSILEQSLVDGDLNRDEAQGLIGRSIFTQYLVDREIVGENRLKRLCGYADLPGVLTDRSATMRLFDWLRDTFNGDMFPPAAEAVPGTEYLMRVRDFLKGTDLETGQTSLFPYRFDVIPVELISAIYEQFVHSAAMESASHTSANPAKRQGVYYTPLAAVSLVLDEVFDGLTGKEDILDLTCGSGVFLVEALRRLVHLKSGGNTPTRQAIRTTLYNQIYGVDISPEAVRIAAFSLYLAALELDPHPHRLDGLRFRPLVGKTLHVNDAFEVDVRDKKFDVIIGNPPWSYKGREGTAARRARNSGSPRQPRGESLNFIRRATDFSHDRTRFGMILSATPFFSRSTTGVEAARSIVEALAPVTLVNLSELSGWLFRNANMPAIALLAGHREQPPDCMTLVQARWSPAGERSHTIEVAPSDINTLPLASWRRNAGLFKAAFLGRRHDLLLLDELWGKLEPLETRLDVLGAELKAGLIVGNRGRDATFLKGLPFAKSGIGHFAVSSDLPPFEHDAAQWPRHRSTYGAPLLLVKEFMLRARPRPVVAVAERDTVFTANYFGASFSGVRPDAAYLLAGILGSALASWYLLMTGSDFGLWMQRLKTADIAALPAPDLERATESDAGSRVVQLVRAFHREVSDSRDWESLDNAVFDLYGLDDEDRIVVRDGLFRASWQWQQGRLDSIRPANVDDLKGYARAFLSTMDAWLSASNRRRMRAEIYRLTPDAPLRVIRFVLEDGSGPSQEVEVVTPDGPLSAVLSRIGERTKVRITDVLVGLRDLRVHAKDEVLIIKPAARRNWLGVHALEDADGVVRAGIRGSGAS